MADDFNFEEAIKERFSKLPKVVQDSITSADVQKRLRSLADTHKLHLDQWQSLENEVMLTLLGIHPVEDLEGNVKNDVGITSEIAHQLAESINTIVFEPIRQELERQLEHPAAKEVVLTGIEAARSQALDAEPLTTPAPQAMPAPAPTPPTPPPETSAARAPASGAYKPGEASTERASIADDPYREPPL